MSASRSARAAVVAAVAVTAVTGGLVVAGRAPTTYAAVSPAAAVLTVLAGLLLVGTGGVRLWTARGGASSVSVLALGVVWWAPVWVGWEQAPALARSVAMVVVPFAPVLLLHLAACLPNGSVTSLSMRRLLAAVTGVTAAYTVARAAVRDPFLDRYCWSNCADNVFLVSAQPGLARVLDSAAAIGGGVVALGATVVAVRRLARTSPVGRRTRWPLLPPVAVAAMAVAVHGVLLVSRPQEDPADPPYLATYLTAGLSLAALGVGLAWLTVDDELRQRALAGLAVDDAARGDLAQTLAAALGDPSLRVAYWLPDGLVDRDGRLVEQADEEAHIDVVRGVERVARVWFDPEGADRAALARQVGSAAVLVIDNERLRAEMLAQVRLLRESRSRVVAAADDARRRLERDLHDGAQQRLLALVLELRVAEARASAAGDLGRARALHDAGRQAHAVVGELRSLAHGIYPAVLDQAGLDGALRTLAEAAPIPVTVEPQPVAGSIPLGTARVLYLAGREAVQAAAGSRADHLRLQVGQSDGHVLLHVTPAFAPSTGLLDRVGAEGGSIRSRDGMLRVEVPCE